MKLNVVFECGVNVLVVDFCIVLLGGLEMVLVMDECEFVVVFVFYGVGMVCVVDFLIGGVFIDVCFMVFCVYVCCGGRFDMFVFGFCGLVVVDVFEFVFGYYVGNNVVVYDWLMLGDFVMYYC